MVKKYRKVRLVQPFNVDDDNMMAESGRVNNVLMIVTAIPFVGALVILLYFIFRRTEEYFEEIKSKK